MPSVYNLLEYIRKNVEICAQFLEYTLRSMTDGAELEQANCVCLHLYHLCSLVTCSGSFRFNSLGAAPGSLEAVEY